MKKLNFYLSIVLILVTGSVVTAQTIDDVISKADAAMGGKAAIDEIKSLKIAIKGTAMGKEATMKVLIMKPTCKLIQMSMSGLENVSATNGTDYWMRQNGKVIDMPEAAVKQFGSSFNQFCGVGIGPLIDNGTFKYIGKEEIDGKSADVIKGVITGSGEVSIYFDEVGLPFKILMPTPEGDLNMYMSDYRDVGGMKIAHKFDSDVKGKPFWNMAISKIEANIDIKPSAFTRPAE